MPLLKNAIKKMRQDKKRTVANKGKKTAMKTAVKKARKETTADNLTLAFSKLDKAAKTNLIHRKKADRLKSRLAKNANKVAQAKEEKPAKKTKAAKKPAAK
jgi:small subunit ribosomal protein S20